MNPTAAEKKPMLNSTYSPNGATAFFAKENLHAPKRASILYSLQQLPQRDTTAFTLSVFNVQKYC